MKREKPTEAQLMAEIFNANNVAQRTGKKHDQAIMNLAFYVNQMKLHYPRTFQDMVDKEKQVEEQIRLNNEAVDKSNAERAERKAAAKALAMEGE